MKHSFLREELKLLACQAPAEGRIISLRELMRLCRNHTQDIYRTLALVLKREWEEFVYHETGTRPQQGAGVVDAEDWKDRFYPDTAAIYAEFEKQYGCGDGFGYSRETFHTLVHEMILADLHLVAGDSPELVSFIKDTGRSIELLKNSTPAQQDEFWGGKFTWVQAQEALGEDILLLEKRRLENAHITREWMLFFGEAEIALQIQSMRLDTYTFQLEMLEADPSLSRAALESMAQEAAAHNKKQLEVLRLQVLLGPYLAKPCPSGTVAPDQCVQYRKELKNLLRKIWLLLHPDVLQKHTSYGRLTELQKEKLKELWHTTMQIQPEELGYRQNQIGYEYRSPSVLRDVLATAKIILEKAGIDINTRYIIRGETLDEQVEWLHKETDRLELESENVRAELKVLLEDRSILEKSAILSCPLEQQEKVKADMLKHSEEMKQHADRAEADLTTLLEKGTV